MLYALRHWTANTTMGSTANPLAVLSLGHLALSLAVFFRFSLSFTQRGVLLLRFKTGLSLFVMFTKNLLLYEECGNQPCSGKDAVHDPHWL